MKMSLTNAEILNLYNALTNMSVNGNSKFTYTIAKNRALLKPHVEALQEAQQEYVKNHPRVQEYQQKREELVKEHSLDKSGKPTVRGDGQGNMTRMVPAENMDKFVSAMEALDDEFKDVLVGMDAHARDFAGILKEQSEVDLRILPFKDIPDSMSTSLMNLMYVFVQDPEEAKAENEKEGLHRVK